MIITNHSKPKLFCGLEELREKYKSEGIPTILPESLNYLILTLKMLKPKRILEIGTAVGISGICMLKESEATLVTIEHDENSFSLAKENFSDFGLTDRVKQYLADGGDVLTHLDAKFDFIFLDGAKARYYDYMYDLLRLLDDGGVIFADNVLFRGYVDGSVKHSHSNNTIVRNLRSFINEMTSNDNLITQILNIGDGILVSYKR